MYSTFSQYPKSGLPSAADSRAGYAGNRLDPKRMPDARAAYARINRSSQAPDVARSGVAAGAGYTNNRPGAKCMPDAHAAYDRINRSSQAPDVARSGVAAGAGGPRFTGRAPAATTVQRPTDKRSLDAIGMSAYARLNASVPTDQDIDFSAHLPAAPGTAQS
ncbi:MAG: hypothetical protein IH617_13455 [Hydrogenophaga sp.]|nr:hypothetical protein [Hydrogenophaga sp.]